VFVRYEDLLRDWAREIGRAGHALDLPLLDGFDRTRFPQVDDFVDPTLHRNRGGWDGLEVPARVSGLADEVWEQLQLLARPDPDAAAVGSELDALRFRYVELHDEAEAIAQSSVTAVKPRPRRKAATKAPAAPPSLRVRLAQRVPARYRRGLRRAIGSLTRS